MKPVNDLPWLLNMNDGYYEITDLLAVLSLPKWILSRYEKSQCFFSSEAIKALLAARKAR